MEKIHTENAPEAIGPYSQAIAHNGLLFVSGQLPLNPKTGQLIEGGIEELTQQVLKNIEAILSEAGSDLSKVLRVDIFMKDLKGDFAAMNGVYAESFKGPVFPARQTVQVSELPLSSPIEISCIAYADSLL